MRSILAASLMASVATGFIAAPGFAQDQTPASTASKAPKDYNADTVLATVNGTPITLGNMIAMVGALPQQYQTLPDGALLKGLLEQMVDQQLLANEESASPETDPLQVKLMMQNERRGALAGVAAQAAVVDAADATAVQAAYDKMLADFKPATEWHAAHILVESEDKAKELKAKIDGGTAFADVAKENSQDGSAASGGDLGWFGTGQMVPEFETAVQGLEADQVSEPVKTQFGWHLVKLVETRDTTPPTLDQARPQIENELRQAALEAKLAELRKAGTVEIKEDAVPPAAIRDGSLLTN